MDVELSHLHLRVEHRVYIRICARIGPCVLVDPDRTACSTLLG